MLSPAMSMELMPFSLFLEEFRQFRMPLNRKMQESVKDRGLDEFEAEFTDGIEAIRVSELLNDEADSGECLQLLRGV